ncbi:MULTISPECIES: hypothetical protein [Bradyrhizobium]|nr:hypothetical protein [Bradyrhizobium sp. NDS-1]WOH70816.1 hypothetical protein RX330_21230 [Bradyrhizobium sp. NDS-1]
MKSRQIIKRRKEDKNERETLLDRYMRAMETASPAAATSRVTSPSFSR